MSVFVTCDCQRTFELDAWEELPHVGYASTRDVAGELLERRRCPCGRELSLRLGDMPDTQREPLGRTEPQCGAAGASTEGARGTVGETCSDLGTLRSRIHLSARAIHGSLWDRAFHTIEEIELAVEAVRAGRSEHLPDHTPIAEVASVERAHVATTRRRSSSG